MTLKEDLQVRIVYQSSRGNESYGNLMNESYGVQGRLAHYVGEGINKSTMMVGVLCEGRSH